MKTSFLEESPGKQSLMRLLAFMAAIAASIIAANAIALAWYIVVANRPDFVTLTVTMFTISGALYVGAEGFKAAQRKVETGGGHV